MKKAPVSKIRGPVLNGQFIYNIRGKYFDYQGQEGVLVQNGSKPNISIALFSNCVR